MSALIDRLNAIAALWIDLVWAIVWQSSLLAVGIAAICFVWKRSSPGVRYWLWQIVAIKLLLMPFWTWAVPMTTSFVSEASETPAAAPPVIVDVEPFVPNDDEATVIEPPRITMIETSSLPAVHSAPTPSLPAPSASVRVRWQSWLFVAWLVVILWQIARLVRQHRSLRQLLREALSNAVDPRCAGLLRECAAEINLSRAPGLRFTEVECSPFVCGMTTPLLVMPRNLCARLDDIQLRQVLLHELAHIARRDLVWGWLPELARLLYFFHPIAHWSSGRIRLERELACDQVAMNFTGRPAADYAATLVHVVTHASAPSALQAAVTSLAMDGGANESKKP